MEACQSRIVLIRGGGDLATGIAHRLWRSGFKVVITELDKPTVIRRTVAFAQAIYNRRAMVEEVLAIHVDLKEALATLAEGNIPVVTGVTKDAVLVALQPWAVVDAIVAKRNTGTALAEARHVIGVGPGFTAGVDVHAVIETMRGHNLGRVITSGMAEADTGIPGEVGGQTMGRLLRAPCAGLFQSTRAIGDAVCSGETTI